MNTPHTNRLPFASMSVPLALLLTSCGFFHGDGHEGMGGRERGHHDFGAPDRPGSRPQGDCDAGLPIEGPDAGEAPDAAIGVDAGSAEDSGSATPDAGACTTSPECPSGSQCQAGECSPCLDGVCTCQRDNDCGGDDLCDHARGVCEALPVTCADLTDEASCLLRDDCSPIYAGANCTDNAGGECTSSDPECTCERYSFASCADRP